MKFGHGVIGGEAVPCALVGGRSYRIAEIFPEAPGTLDRMIRDDRDWLGEIAAAAAVGGFEAAEPVSPEAWAPPLLDPRSVHCIGLNYLDHCRESELPVPDSPLLFAKLTSSIVGDGEPIRWDPRLTAQVDWEAELGVVIGRDAKRVSAADALSHVAGYTVVNDVSARDLQKAESQWTRAKGIDTFCPIGPFMITAEAFGDPGGKWITSRLNGETMQDSSTSEMVFGVAEIISYLSRTLTLRAGDVVATGTPAGVGAGRNPAVFMRDGDLIEVEIEGIGTLSNRCRVEEVD